eukprot:364417-Chlamydomonas_euryale.AAC.6
MRSSVANQHTNFSRLLHITQSARRASRHSAAPSIRTHAQPYHRLDIKHTNHNFHVAKHAGMPSVACPSLHRIQPPPPPPPVVDRCPLVLQTHRNTCPGIACVSWGRPLPSLPASTHPPAVSRDRFTRLVRLRARPRAQLSGSCPAWQPARRDELPPVCESTPWMPLQ